MLMLRMEIALLLILGMVASIYFSAERKHSLLHRTFSVLLVTVIIHLVLDSVTIYTVNHLDTVPAVLNMFLHRMFLGSMVFVIFLFYQYIAILVEEETGKSIRKFDVLARIFLMAAEIGAFVLPVTYTKTPQGNYSSGSYVIDSDCYNNRSCCRSFDPWSDIYERIRIKSGQLYVRRSWHCIYCRIGAV